MIIINIDNDNDNDNKEKKKLKALVSKIYNENKNFDKLNLLKN